MPRSKLTARINSNLADALQRVARIDDRSVSDVIEDAIARYFERAHSEADHHALLARLDRLASRLGAIERNQETLFELTAHAARFNMSIAPDVPERDRSVVNARGSERFRNVVSAIVTKVAAGKSVLREQFQAAAPGVASPSASAAPAAQTPAPAHVEAAE